MRTCCSLPVGFTYKLLLLQSDHNFTAVNVDRNTNLVNFQFISQEKQSLKVGWIKVPTVGTEIFRLHFSIAPLFQLLRKLPILLFSDGLTLVLFRCPACFALPSPQHLERV